jgi:hypothetical protein
MMSSTTDIIVFKLDLEWISFSPIGTNPRQKEDLRCSFCSSSSNGHFSLLRSPIVKAQYEEDKTEQIRSALYFLQFIENKIIKKQIFNLNNQDLNEIDGFSRFISLHMK